jgi:OmpA-OmpF porin, OOP family
VGPGSVIAGGAAAFAGLCAMCIARHASMVVPAAPPAIPPAVVAPAPGAVVEAAPDTAATRVVAAIAQRLAGRTIEFETNSAVITPRGRAILDSLVPILASAPNERFEVAGHTDARGNPVRNQTLSEERAASVVRYLGRRGIADTRLTPRGYGATRPLTADTAAAALQRNRRIEFTPLSEP